MTRSRRGTVVKTRDGRYQPVVLVKDANGKTTRRRLRPLPAGTSIEKARERAAHWQARFDAEGVVRPVSARDRAATKGTRAREKAAETWWEAYFLEREARGLGYVDQERGRHRKHIAPIVTAPMAEITEADCEALRDYLDEQWNERKECGGRAGMSWQTAWNVWSLFTTACKVAAGKKTGGKFRSKNRALRVRDDNPCAEVSPPDKGAEKRRPWILPSEGRALLHCAAVPVERRRRYAVALYTYLRPEELRAIEWGDVDLETGRIHVHRAADETGKVKTTKTDQHGHVPIEPTLLPLLRAMHDEADGSGPVLDLPARKFLSADLRGDMRAAGVDREALFVDVDDPTRKRLVFRDLRATGITWRSLRGDPELHVQRQAGHEDLSTTSKHYVRDVDAPREEVDGVFPALPADLCGAPEVIADLITGPQVRENMWAHRDSNPGPRG